MQKIFIALSAFSDKGNDEELTKVDLRKPEAVPNYPNLQTPKQFKDIFPKIDVPKAKGGFFPKFAEKFGNELREMKEKNVKAGEGRLLTESEVQDRHLSELNNHVSEATLELGKQPDRHTRYQLHRVNQMSVRYENNTMPNENI